MKYKNIVLIGMMGSGKSTVAEALAERLCFDFVDLDLIFEEKQGMSIADYFSLYSEEKFRDIETKILKENIIKKNLVISTGGGIVLKKENQNLIFDSSIFSIYLKANSNEIYDRIKDDTSRPLLKVENVKEKIDEIIKNREKLYNLAKFSIDTNSKKVSDIVIEIEELWKKY